MDYKYCVCCGIGTVSREEDSFDICPVCGWEDDSLQNDNPDYAGGANTLSLNEYRKEFEGKRKKNPDYMWEKEVVDYNFGTNKPTEFKDGVTDEDKRKLQKIKL